MGSQLPLDERVQRLERVVDGMDVLIAALTGAVERNGRLLERAEQARRQAA